MRLGNAKYKISAQLLNRKTSRVSPDNRALTQLLNCKVPRARPDDRASSQLLDGEFSRKNPNDVCKVCVVDRYRHVPDLNVTLMSEMVKSVLAGAAIPIRSPMANVSGPVPLVTNVNTPLVLIVMVPMVIRFLLIVIT